MEEIFKIRTESIAGERSRAQRTVKQRIIWGETVEFN